MAERWIVIPNWDRFQHYKDRDPLWIKLHRGLASDPDWLELSGHDRAVLVGLWLEYASSNCRIRLDTRSITRRLSLRVTMASLERLNHAGLIQIFASKPLAQRREEKNIKDLPYTSTTDVPVDNSEPKGKPVFDIGNLLKEIPR